MHLTLLRFKRKISAGDEIDARVGSNPVFIGALCLGTIMNINKLIQLGEKTACFPPCLCNRRKLNCGSLIGDKHPNMFLSRRFEEKLLNRPTFGNTDA